jgi:prophage regulatory protein
LDAIVAGEWIEHVEGVLVVSALLPRIVTKKELRQIVPYSAQHILRLEKQGRFPRRIQIGLRRVGWRLSEIENWLAQREQQSPSQSAAR